MAGEPAPSPAANWTCGLRRCCFVCILSGLEDVGRRDRPDAHRRLDAESRMEHPAFTKQSSLVDETGIEPATSSLRTVGKIS